MQPAIKVQEQVARGAGGLLRSEMPTTLALAPRTCGLRLVVALQIQGRSPAGKEGGGTGWLFLPPPFAFTGGGGMGA
jgi:hypothetical protein